LYKLLALGELTRLQINVFVTIWVPVLCCCVSNLNPMVEPIDAKVSLFYVESSRLNNE